MSAMTTEAPSAWKRRAVAAPMPDAPPVTEVTCAALPPVTTGTCQVTPGGAAKLVQGEVLTPTKLFHGGQVAVDAQGSITCVGCDCAGRHSDSRKCAVDTPVVDHQ